MECKIGEIFEYNSDWYQCIRASKFDCFDCDLGHIWNCKSKFPCEILQRKDGEQVIFKKLEKVGEPYQYIDGIYQEYKATLPFFIRDATYIETVNGFAIKIKQNKEDMEEKKIQHYDCFFDREPSKSNLKPFDLEAAKAGKPVCTRDGRKARIICFNAKTLCDYPIIALVEGVYHPTYKGGLIMLAITFEEYKKYGCPNCGCFTQVSSSSGLGSSFVTCNHCKLHFEIRANEHIESHVKSGVRPKEPWNPKSELVFESGILIKHPRTDIPKWHWEPKDVRPEHGEYWSPRGIGYDLSGFVKSKRAGERIHEIVKKVLGKEKPKSWLDYRENEPTWIQYKLHPEEFNLEQIYIKTKDSGILTEEILIETKI
jgi:hypothetical protein